MIVSTGKIYHSSHRFCFCRFGGDSNCKYKAWINEPFLTVYLQTLSILGIYFSYNVWFHPLAKYPGPKLRAASRLPHLAAMLGGHLHLDMKRLHDEYGGVVRVTPDKLSYISSEAWRQIYGHKKNSEPEMSKDRKWYVADPNAQHIIFSTREKHGHFRCLFSQGFSDRSLREQEPLLQSYVDMLVQWMEQNVVGGRTALDVVEWYNWTTFDIIGDLTFGEPFGCLKNTSLHPWVRDMFDAIKGIMYLRVCQEVSVLGRHIPILLKNLFSAKAVEKREAHLHFTRDMVTRRVNTSNHRSDFMENALCQLKGKGITFAEMLSNSSVLIMAGSETTATLLSGATYLLLKNPEKQQKLVEELDAVFQQETNITNEATGRLVTFRGDRRSIALLSSCGCRLPRQVPAGGSYIEGKYVPAGTSVTVNHFAAYHSSINFHRPDDFIPERFIEGSNSSDKRDVLQPFSAGPRNCIGRNLAYAEARLILERVFFRFELNLSDKTSDWLDQGTYGIWQKPPLYVTFRIRRRSESTAE
ncbi:hypothetical protein BDV12DRAFT_203986 [Aspergillus spectabilis]